MAGGVGKDGVVGSGGDGIVGEERVVFIPGDPEEYVGSRGRDQKRGILLGRKCLEQSSPERAVPVVLDVLIGWWSTMADCESRVDWGSTAGLDLSIKRSAEEEL